MLRFSIVLLFAGCFDAVFAQMRMISHVTRTGGGFTTTVQVENLAVDTVSYTLIPYDAAGNALTRLQGNLAPGEVIATPAGDLFEDGDLVSHFEIDAGEQTKVSVAYDFEGLGSPAHVAARGDRASSWRIFPGDWEHVFDGLALVNMGEEPTDVWLGQRDYLGNFQRAEKIATALAPRAKALYVMGSPDGSNFSLETPSYFEVSADQKLTITALRGTLGREDIGLLWANEARALSQAESKRDDKGVWFITDGTLYDVMEMMGYNVATDRLWQMETFRRVARGRLAELFGLQAVNQDRTTRITNYSDEELETFFQAMDEESKILVRAYVDGVNRRIAQVNTTEQDRLAVSGPFPNSLLPFQYRVLGRSAVEPWDIKDVLGWISKIQRDFTLPDGGFGQVENAALLQQLNDFTGDPVQAAAMFDDLRWTNDQLTPTMIHRSSVTKTSVEEPSPPILTNPKAPDLRTFAREYRRRLDEDKETLQRLAAYVKMGSYAWVISGERTQSGNPILYAGPQMGFTAPSVALEGSIQSDALSVSGMTVAGLPFILIGRTPNHAWSFQVGHAHCWDFFIEDNPDEITVHHTEIIKVAGAEDVELPVRRSPRGPIIAQVDGQDISWQYAHWGHEFKLSQGGLGLARAQNIDEFGQAVENLGVSQHVLYADKEGNIGYWMSGRTPRRPDGDYRFPQGFLGPAVDYDVQDVLPLPHDRNPPQGWYGGWNSKASDSVPDASSTFFLGPFQRGHIIQERLAEKDDWNFEQARDLAIDMATTFSIDLGGVPWYYMRDIGGFMDVVLDNANQERTDAMLMMESWDGHMSEGSDNWILGPDFEDAFLLQNNWMNTVTNNIFRDELGPDLEIILGATGFNALMRHLSGHPFGYDWFPNVNDSTAPGTLEEIIVSGLDFELTDLGEQPWGLGIRGQLPYTSLFFTGALGVFNFSNRSTYGQCVELGPQGPIRIETHFSPGQSGTLLTDETGGAVTVAGTRVAFGIGRPEPAPGVVDHFVSMRDLFENFEHRPFPLFQ